MLPPLETMEQVLFATIHVGVILLTLSVFSGLIFVENAFAQHLVHKDRPIDRSPGGIQLATVRSLAISDGVDGAPYIGRWPDIQCCCWPISAVASFSSSSSGSNGGSPYAE